MVVQKKGLIFSEWICGICNGSFGSEDKAKQCEEKHIPGRSRFSNDLFKCPHCGSNFEGEDKLTKHLERVQLKAKQLKMIDVSKAEKHEKLREFEEAAQIYKLYGMDDDVIRVRDEARNKVEQTVVHGDYVDDRDTIVKDSVVNKSSIGAGGKSKAEEIKEIKELLDSGAIDKDDYEKMKREIIG